jgi:hypothetical protein
MNYETIIPLKKSKLLFGVCATTLFALLNLFIVTAAIFGKSNSNRLLLVIGLFGIALFGSLSFFGLKRMFSRKYNLVINEIGILDNLSEYNFGLIKWDEIINVKTEKIVAPNIVTTTVLIVMTKNPQKYFVKINFLRALLLKLNQKKYGTPVLINISNLDFDLARMDFLIQSKTQEQRNIMPNS